MKNAVMLKDITTESNTIIPAGTLVEVADENICSPENEVSIVEIRYHNLSYIVSRSDIEFC